MESSKKSLHKSQWSLKEIPMWNTVDFSHTHRYSIKAQFLITKEVFFYSAKYDTCHFVVPDIPNSSFVTDLLWTPGSCSVPHKVPDHGSRSLKHILNFFFPTKGNEFFSQAPLSFLVQKCFQLEHLMARLNSSWHAGVLNKMKLPFRHSQPCHYAVTSFRYSECMS